MHPSPAAAPLPEHRRNVGRNGGPVEGSRPQQRPLQSHHLRVRHMSPPIQACRKPKVSSPEACGCTFCSREPSTAQQLLHVGPCPTTIRPCQLCALSAAARTPHRLAYTSGLTFRRVSAHGSACSLQPWAVQPAPIMPSKQLLALAALALAVIIASEWPPSARWRGRRQMGEAGRPGAGMLRQHPPAARCQPALRCRLP